MRISVSPSETYRLIVFIRSAPQHRQLVNALPPQDLLQDPEHRDPEHLNAERRKAAGDVADAEENLNRQVIGRLKRQHRRDRAQPVRVKPERDEHARKQHIEEVHEPVQDIDVHKPERKHALEQLEHRGNHIAEHKGRDEQKQIRWRDRKSDLRHQDRRQHHGRDAGEQQRVQRLPEPLPDKDHARGDRPDEIVLDDAGAHPVFDRRSEVRRDERRAGLRDQNVDHHLAERAAVDDRLPARAVQRRPDKQRHGNAHQSSDSS